MTTSHLPIPNAEALTHSQKLFEYILTQIRANQGKISFDTFMNLALYTPGLGYYCAGNQKFGQTGDFVTAPEISPLFSKCVARQCQQVLEVLKDGNILEIGAGSGQMAADILLTLAAVNQLPKHYYILELSADLKLRQQEKIAALCPDLFPRVLWLDTLPNPGFQGLILANEVLDAMPVFRFQITDQGPQEMQVVEKEKTLYWKLSPSENSELLDLYHSADWGSWPIGYASEINLNLKPWIHSLSDILKSGVLFIIDYGFPRKEYYHPDRDRGTLMCHYQHYAHHNPFLYPGLQDITAHVDFTAIAEAAVDATLDVLGYCNQASFLLSCGLLDHSVPVETNGNAAFLKNQAIHTLTSPAEMGELFKVIALGKNFDEPLVGFVLSDKSHTL